VAAPTSRRAPRPGAVRRPRRVAPAALALLVLVSMTCVAGCPCVHGIVNASEGLRWWLFSSFGAERMCPEMLKHGGVALRLTDRGAAIGRFFPSQCAHRVDDANRTVTVDFTGDGYAYMAPAKRVGFSCTVSVEYRPDFQLSGDAVYVWARLSRVVSGPHFQLGHVENPVLDAAANIGPLEQLANLFGSQIVGGELSRGFTVVHDEDKGNAFALGIVLPPDRPFTPYDVSEDDAFTFANETVEIAAEQRDYLGPFEITDEDQALDLRLSLQGPNGVDVLVVQKSYGDTWRAAYQAGRDLGPPGPVFTGFPIGPGYSKRRIKLPPGLWHVVIDNTSRVGMVAPVAGVPILDQFITGSSVQLSYVAQLVEE
jgi:hypothetical protein